LDGNKSIGNGHNEYLPLAINKDDKCLFSQKQWTKFECVSFHLALWAFDVSFPQPLLSLQS
jgi:hypothetical protein